MKKKKIKIIVLVILLLIILSLIIPKCKAASVVVPPDYIKESGTLATGTGDYLAIYQLIMNVSHFIEDGEVAGFNYSYGWQTLISLVSDAGEDWNIQVNYLSEDTLQYHFIGVGSVSIYAYYMNGDFNITQGSEYIFTLPPFTSVNLTNYWNSTIEDSILSEEQLKQVNLYSIDKDYQLGYVAGYTAGEKEGLPNEESYNKGYAAGQKETEGNFSNWINSIIRAIQNFLSLDIGGVTLGALVLIPLSIELVAFIIKMFSGGQNG